VSVFSGDSVLGLQAIGTTFPNEWNIQLIVNRLNPEGDSFRFRGTLMVYAIQAGGEFGNRPLYVGHSNLYYMSTGLSVGNRWGGQPLRIFVRWKQAGISYLVVATPGPGTRPT